MTPAYDDTRGELGQVRRYAPSQGLRLPPASTLEEARRQAVKLMGIRRRYGAESNVTQEQVDRAEERVRAMAAELGPRPLQPSARECRTITWLEHPITIGESGTLRIVGFDPLTADPAVLELLGIDAAAA
jgi:hypothetical protein